MPVDPTTERAILSGKLLPGMTFHQKIWALCSRVPRGKVATYADLASALGSRGYRAAGNAMNRNPYAPRVPCHRIVGSDGQLTGYAGGLSRKRNLLKQEGVRFVRGRVDPACRVGREIFAP
ncbi:MAG: MGMT family protein [Phycisphaerales bacterium]|nr:MGMT family protein [Phycisphaerales bacterium]